MSDALVRLIDLAPTMLDLVGVSGPPEFEGRSLVPSIGGRAYDMPPAYLEAMDANLTRNWAPMTGLVSETYKLIDVPIPELYDLASDGKEATNLFSREPERARTLSALLQGLVASFHARGTAAEKTTLNAEARRRLQALGYVAATADRAGRRYTEADDPKTLIGAANDLQRALATFNAGSPDEAMAQARAIVRAHPDFVTAYGVIASMQRDAGDLRGAIATLEDVARRGADQSVMVVLAGYLQEAGALDRSIAVLEAILAAHPDYADAYNSLGVAYSRLGRHGEARAAFERVLQLDPTSATAYENLGRRPARRRQSRRRRRGSRPARSRSIHDWPGRTTRSPPSISASGARLTPSRSGVWRSTSSRSCMTRSTTSARRCGTPATAMMRGPFSIASSGKRPRSGMAPTSPG